MVVKKKIVKKRVSPVKKVVKKKSSRWGMGYATRN